MDFLYLIKNVFFAAVLVSLGAAPATASELPFHKAMAHLTPDLSQFPLLKKYHLLKSLAWGKARATVVDPLAFVSEIFVIQVSMVKSLKAFLSLADIWNGKQKDFPIYFERALH